MSNDVQENNVHDNAERHRFELKFDGHTAFSMYNRADGVITFRHTEVPIELRGHGAGSKLVRGALDIVRGEALKVRPLCPFVKAFIDAHPDYADMLV